MNKIFLNVLHEEEKLEDVSMDVLKGGLVINDCGCNTGNIECRTASVCNYDKF